MRICDIQKIYGGFKMSDKKFYLLSCVAMCVLIVLSWVYGFVLSSLGVNEATVDTYLAGVLTIAMFAFVISEGGKVR